MAYTNYEELKARLIADRVGALPFKMFMASLSTADGSDPEVTVLWSNFDSEIVWTRQDIGNYIGTCTGEFTANKTSSFSGIGRIFFTDVGNPYELQRTSDDTVQLLCYEDLSSAKTTDNGFINSLITIYVFP